MRRYIMNAVVADFTGERTVNLFNDEAQQLLGGLSADELHALKARAALGLASHLVTSSCHSACPPTMAAFSLARSLPGVPAGGVQSAPASRSEYLSVQIERVKRHRAVFLRRRRSGLRAQEANGPEFEDALAAPAFHEWTLDSSVKAREYNGKTSLRISVRSARPAHWAADAAALARLIEACL